MWGRDACGVLQEKRWGLQGLPLSPESFGVSPASGAFTDGVWRPWGLGQMSVLASARDPRGPWQPQLGSMLWLHQPPWGFLEPSPQHLPVLSGMGQPYSAPGRLYPLRTICCPISHHTHSWKRAHILLYQPLTAPFTAATLLWAAIRAGGYADTSTMAPSTTLLPVLVFLP